MMEQRNNIATWLKWGSTAGVVYCCLCFCALLMAVQGGIFPEPGDQPPSDLTATVSVIGRKALIVLTWPVAKAKRYFPGKALPCIDYLYFFITGFAVGSLAYCGWKLKDRKRTEANNTLVPTVAKRSGGTV